MLNRNGWCYVCDEERKIERAGLAFGLNLLLVLLTSGLWLVIWALSAYFARPWHCGTCDSSDVALSPDLSAYGPRISSLLPPSEKG